MTVHQVPWKYRLSRWLREHRPRRSAVQLMLSVGGVALLCVAGLLVSVVLGVALAGLGCWFVERRISA